MLSAWLFLNLRAGTSGLVRTVANGYYYYRRKGFSHEESIAREIADRYRFLGAGKDVQLASLLDERLDSSQPELDQVKDFVFLLFSVLNMGLTQPRMFEIESGTLLIGSATNVLPGRV